MVRGQGKGLGATQGILRVRQPWGKIRAGRPCFLTLGQERLQNIGRRGGCQSRRLLEAEQEVKPVLDQGPVMEQFIQLGSRFKILQAE